MKTKRKSQRAGRMRGRPAAVHDTDVPAELMQAARKLFLRHGYDKVTARQIAAAAGTTPAMIHYYYQNKLGLFRAMAMQAVAPFARLLEDALRTDATRTPDIAALMQMHIRTAAANPWMVTLIVNEVLAEGGQLRAMFVRDIASQLLPLLVQILERARDAGSLRPDLDLKLTALSLLSLNVFPFISHVVTGPLLGLKLEKDGLERLIAHTCEVVLKGIAPSTGRTS